MRIIPVMEANNQVLIKNAILNAVLRLIPFQGWCNSTLEEASKSAGYNEKMVHLVFPGGVNTVLDYYLKTLDKEMLSKVLSHCQNLKVREKVFAAVKERVQIMSKQKALTVKTFTYLSLPWNLPLTAKFSWRTVDLIWREICHDTSTDFNYYTKRSLLYAVYQSTLLYWLSDDSEENSDTFDFLSRRINDVLKIGSFVSKLKPSH